MSHETQFGPLTFPPPSVPRSDTSPPSSESLGTAPSTEDLLALMEKNPSLAPLAASFRSYLPPPAGAFSSSPTFIGSNPFASTSSTSPSHALIRASGDSLPAWSKTDSPSPTSRQAAASSLNLLLKPSVGTLGNPLHVAVQLEEQNLEHASSLELMAQLPPISGNEDSQNVSPGNHSSLSSLRISNSFSSPPQTRRPKVARTSASPPLTPSNLSPKKAFANVAPYTPSTGPYIPSTAFENSSTFSSPSPSRGASQPPSTPTNSPSSPLMITSLASPSNAPVGTTTFSAVPPPRAFGINSFRTSSQTSNTYLNAVQQSHTAAPHSTSMRERSIPSSSDVPSPTSSKDLTFGLDYWGDFDGNKRILCKDVNGFCIMTAPSVSFESAYGPLIKVIELVADELLFDIEYVKNASSSSSSSSSSLSLSDAAILQVDGGVPKRRFGAVCREDRCRVHFYVHVFDGRIPLLKLFERLILDPRMKELDMISRIYPVTFACHPKIDFVQTCIDLITSHLLELEKKEAAKSMSPNGSLDSSFGSSSVRAAAIVSPSASTSASSSKIVGSGRKGLAATSAALSVAPSTHSVSIAKPREGPFPIGLAIEAHHASEYAAELKDAIETAFHGVTVAPRAPLHCEVMLSVCFFNDKFACCLWEPIAPNNLNNYRPGAMLDWLQNRLQLDLAYIPRTPYVCDPRPLSKKNGSNINLALVETPPSHPLTASTSSLASSSVFANNDFIARPFSSAGTALVSSSNLNLLRSSAPILATPKPGPSPYGPIGAPGPSNLTNQQHQGLFTIGKTATPYGAPHAGASSASFATNADTTAKPRLNHNVDPAVAKRAHSINTSRHRHTGPPKASSSSTKVVPGSTKRQR